jgi:hypothetical protein
MPNDKELIQRAYAAWLRYWRHKSDQPTLSASTVETYDGLTYVMLRRGEQVVDVYRYIEARNMLERVRRYWPGPYGRQRAAA